MPVLTYPVGLEFGLGLNYIMRRSRGETGGPVTPLKNHKNIGFLSNTGPDNKETLIISQRRVWDHTWPHRENEMLKTDTKATANICNLQFQSAFTLGANTVQKTILLSTHNICLVETILLGTIKHM